MERGFGEIPQHIQTLSRGMYETASAIEHHLRWRKAAISILAVVDVSLITLGVRQAYASDLETSPQVICADNHCEQASMVLDGVNAPEARSTPASQLAALVTPEASRKPEPVRPKAEMVEGLDPAIAEKMGAMNLTMEGYQEFLASIDLSFFDFAQQFPEFNPSIVPMRQGSTEFNTLHFTAFYRNADGPNPVAAGKMLVPPFIQGLATRGDIPEKPGDSPDHKCCGINAVIDRDGVLYQFAPFDAKLRHNKGKYDSQTTGVEFEATLQTEITTKMYETGAYWLIANWQADQNLRKKPFWQTVRGHGETRAEEPEQGHRSDFMAPSTEYYRRNVQMFVNSFPELLEIPVKLR